MGRGEELPAAARSREVRFHTTRSQQQSRAQGTASRRLCLRWLRVAMDVNIPLWSPELWSPERGWGAHLHRFDGAGLSLHIKAPDGSVVCLNGLLRCWPRQARRSVWLTMINLFSGQKTKGAKGWKWTHVPRAIGETLPGPICGLPPSCQESFCAFADSR